MARPPAAPRRPRRPVRAAAVAGPASMLCRRLGHRPNLGGVEPGGRLGELAPDHGQIVNRCRLGFSFEIGKAVLQPCDRWRPSRSRPRRHARLGRLEPASLAAEPPRWGGARRDRLVAADRSADPGRRRFRPPPRPPRPRSRKVLPGRSVSGTRWPRSTAVRSTSASSRWSSI
jgi:hypothetical protein